MHLQPFSRYRSKMISPHVLSPLRAKLRVIGLLAVAVMALAIPTTAFAGPVTPVIDSPSSGVVVGSGSRTIAFTASDPSPATYTLLRYGPVIGACDPTPTLGALQIDSVPDDTSDLVDGNSLGSGDYCYWVEADDGSTKADSATLLITIDVTAPATPTSFALSGSTPRKTAPSFTFGASSDPSGPVTYKLYRDATLADSSTSTTLTDSPVPADGTYVYTVVAVDSLGNASAASSGISVRTDNAAPSPRPNGLTLTGPPNPRSSGFPPSFSYSTSSDPSGVTYRLYRDGMLTTQTSLSSTIVDGTIAMDGTGDGTYVYTIRAIDSLTNETIDSNSVSVIISAGAPSVPIGLRAAATPTRSAPVISWNASTGTPTAYRVFRNGQQIGTVNAPTTTFSDPLPLDGSADAD
jgi:hypothetical protein